MKKLFSLLIALAMILTLAPAVLAEGFAENVTITIPVYDRGQAGVPNVEDNYWTNWIQENFGNKYNVTVKYVGIPRSDVMNK